MEGDCIKTYLYMRGPFQAGDHKAAINRRAQKRNMNKTEITLMIHTKTVFLPHRDDCKAGNDFCTKGQVWYLIVLIPGLEVIKLKFILRLKIKLNQCALF